MKFYIVDNGSVHLNKITEVLSTTHEYVVDKYQPHKSLDAGDADAIILTGGMTNEVCDKWNDGNPWYHQEFELIQKTNKPIFAICLGLQIAVVAFGGRLKKLPKLIKGPKIIDLKTEAKEVFGCKALDVFEAHQWVADEISKTGFKVYATSEDGIEMLYHPTRQIIATQFHPEMFINNTSKATWNELINLLINDQRVR